MSVAGGIEQRAVVVECCSTPDNLVAAVAVDIGDGEVVVAVGVERVAADEALAVAALHAARVGGCRLDAVTHQDVAVDLYLDGGGACLVEHQRLRGAGRGVEPLSVQAGAVEADGPDVSLGVVAAAEDAAGALVGTVDVGDGSEETLRAVAVVVAPEARGQAAHFAQLRAALGEVGPAVGILRTRSGASRQVPRGVYGGTRLAIEYGEVFRALQNVAVAVAVVAVIGVGEDGSVGSRLVDVVALSVDGARRRLAHHLGAPVAVEVVDHELRVVGAVADVLPQVDAPEQLTIRQLAIVDFVAVDIGVAGIALVIRVVLSMR